MSRAHMKSGSFKKKRYSILTVILVFSWAISSYAGPIHDVARTGDVDLLETLLAKNPDPLKAVNDRMIRERPPSILQR